MIEEINEESIEAYQKILSDPKSFGFHFKPFKECFIKSEICTAKHILAQQYTAYINKPLPKLVCYIIMDTLLGPCNGKDDKGNFGYYLSLNIE